MFSDVSKTKELRPGFVQTAYKKSGARAIILLFDVRQGAELPQHNHPESQFGYTFHGDYNFVIDDTNYLTSAGTSYLIDGRVLHSAVAINDYYSLDFKYLSASPMARPFSFQVIQPAVDKGGQPIGEIRFDDVSGGARAVQFRNGIDYCLPSLPPDGLRERILVVSEDTDIIIDGQSCHAEAMKIYHLDIVEKLQLRVGRPGAEAFLFEI